MTSQRFFKLTKLEKGKGSRIVTTVIFSASTDDTTEERDDTINNSSVEDEELRAYDDINTIQSMANEAQSTYTDETKSTSTYETQSTCTYETKSTYVKLSTTMKSTRLTSITEESTFDGTMYSRSVDSSGSSTVVDNIIAALCGIRQPKYLTLDKSESKLGDEDSGYVIEDESNCTDNGDESYHEHFKSWRWTACQAPVALPVANTSDSKVEGTDSRDHIDTFLSQRIDLDDTSCHSFKFGLEGNYSIVVTSSSTFEESSVQILEAKDFVWGTGEKDIETQLDSSLSRPPTQTPQGRIEPVISERKVVHLTSSDSLTSDDDISLEDDNSLRVVHLKSSVTLNHDTHFDLEQFKQNFFGKGSSKSKHYTRRRFERLLGRRIW
jgi:hypothetical protein